MTHLFRVEDYSHVGPYTHQARSRGIQTGENGYRIHCRNDSLMPTSPEEIFVFRSLNLLHAWFSPDFEALKCAGYRVVTFLGSPELIRDGLSGRQSVYLDVENSFRIPLNF